MARAQDQKLEMLSKVPLLSGLTSADIAKVGRICDEVDLPAGKVVIRQGAFAAEFYVIVDGTVSIERDGRALGTMGPGEFFGELAMLANIPRTATGTCVTDCRFLVLDARSFNQLLTDYPKIQHKVLHALAQRVALLEREHAV